MNCPFEQSLEVLLRIFELNYSFLHLNNFQSFHDKVKYPQLENQEDQLNTTEYQKTLKGDNKCQLNEPYLH